MTSINTNIGALAALQNLRATQDDLADVSSRVSTGMKVATASDNPAIFAIAQDLRSRLVVQGNIRDGMDRMTSMIDAGVTGATKIQNVLTEMRSRAAAVVAGGITSGQVNSLQLEFVAMRDQINSIVGAAQLNGQNLINDSTQSFQVRLNDADLTQAMSVTGQGLTSASLGVATLSIANATDAAAALGSISTALATVNTALGALGARSKITQMMKDFSQTLSDSIEKSIGLLVDADMPRESSRLQALQTKQQLGIQTLAIANQQPAALLQLFR